MHGTHHGSQSRGSHHGHRSHSRGSHKSGRIDPDHLAEEAGRIRRNAPDSDLKFQVRILKKAPDQRTQEELRKLAATFSHIKFFKGLDPHLMMQLCGVLRLEHWPGSSVVFREGERGDKFFMILSGSVSLFIQNMSASDVEVSKEEDPQESESSVDPPEERRPLLKRLAMVARQMMNAPADQEENDGSSAPQSSEQVEKELRLKKRMRKLLGLEAGEPRDERTGQHMGLLEAARQSVERMRQKHESDEEAAGRSASQVELTEKQRKRRRTHQFQAAVARIGVSKSIVNCMEELRRLREDLDQKSPFAVSHEGQGDLTTPTVTVGPSKAEPDDVGIQGRDTHKRSSKGHSEMSHMGQQSARAAANIRFADPASSSSSSSSSGSRNKGLSSSASSGSSSRSSSSRSSGSSTGGGGNANTGEEDDGKPIPEDTSGEREGTDEQDQNTQSAALDAAGSESHAEGGSHLDGNALHEITPSTNASASINPAQSNATPTSPPTHENVKQLNRSVSLNITTEDSDAGSGRDSVLSSGASLDVDMVPVTPSRRAALVPFSPKMSSPLSPDSKRRSRKSTILRHSPLCEVGKLKTGAAFGEVALQNDQPRSATIRTNESSYFAVLTREDYRRIFFANVENQKRLRLEFIQKVPLLSGLSPQKYAKITTMLQHREVRKNEVICGPDSVVLQVYIVYEGEFAVMPMFGDRAGAAAEDSLEDGQVAAMVQESSNNSIGRKSDRNPITSLVVAPQIFGLTAYLRCEKRYPEKVVCYSANGTIYCILAKELVSHLPRELRTRLLTAAHAQKRFYDNRSAVLQGLQLQPMREKCTVRDKERHWRCKGSRFWPEQETFDRRLARMTGKAIDHSSLSVYTPGDRLRIIGAAFQAHDDEEQAPVESTNGAGGTMQTSGKTSGNADEEVAQNRACWWVEALARSAELEEEHFSWPPKEKEEGTSESGAMQALSRLLGTHVLPESAVANSTTPAGGDVSDAAVRAALEEEWAKEVAAIQRFKATKTLHYMGPRLRMRSARAPAGTSGKQKYSQRGNLSQFRMNNCVSAPNLFSRSPTSSPVLYRNISAPTLSRDTDSATPAGWMTKDGDEENDSWNAGRMSCSNPAKWKPPDVRFFAADFETHVLKVSGEDEIILLSQRAEEVAAARRAEEKAAAKAGLLFPGSPSSTMRSSVGSISSPSLGNTARGENSEKVKSVRLPPACSKAEERIAQMPAVVSDLFSTKVLQSPRGGPERGAAGQSGPSLPVVSSGQIFSHPLFDRSRRTPRDAGSSQAHIVAENSARTARPLRDGSGHSRWCVATPLPEIKSTRGIKWNRVEFDRRIGSLHM